MQNVPMQQLMLYLSVNVCDLDQTLTLTINRTHTLLYPDHTMSMLIYRVHKFLLQLLPMVTFRDLFDCISLSLHTSFLPYDLVNLWAFSVAIVIICLIVGILKLTLNTILLRSIMLSAYMFLNVVFLDVLICP